MKFWGLINVGFNVADRNAIRVSGDKMGVQRQYVSYAETSRRTMIQWGGKCFHRISVTHGTNQAD
jgi:hypothetical protein